MSWNDYFEGTLAKSNEQQLLRRRTPRIELDSTRFLDSSGRVCLNFATNDYLGLRFESRIRQAAARQLSAGAVGSGASPLISGYSLGLAELESQIARWQQVQSCMVLASGYAMNVGVVAALASTDDLLLSDQLNHASLIDGCRLSGAHKRIYPHNDVDAVEAILKKERHRYPRALLITESLFSMDGDQAPLVQLQNLCVQYDVGLVVDEAHATGVYGPQGAGLGEQLHATDQWLAKLGTLGKGLGTCGGFVCGSTLLIQYLINRCRSYVFSTAIAPPTAAATLAAVQWIPELTDRRQRLLSISQATRLRLQAAGYQVSDGDSPIIPIIVGRSEDAIALSQKLASQGLYVPAIRPPTVPAGTARLRLSLSAAHSDEQLQQLLDALCNTL